MNKARELTGAALFWLLTEQRCTLVTVERGFGWGNPDALGMLPDRRLVEVDVKTSMRDFRANAHKNHVQSYNIPGLDSPGIPSKYYFLVPPEISQRVISELPEYAGLLTIDGDKSWGNGARLILVIKQAPRMPRRRLTVNQAITMAKNQSRAFVSEYLRTTSDLSFKGNDSEHKNEDTNHA